MWNVTFDLLLKELSANNIAFTAFADDLLIMVEGPSRSELELAGNNCLRIISNNLKSMGLELSLGKCTAITFAKRLNKCKVKALKRKPIFKIDNISVKNQSSLKYLGLVIDEKLNWFQHIQALKSKTLNLSYGMLRVAPNSGGVKSNMLKIWYQTTAERILLYAAAAWGPDLSVAASKALDSLQRPFLLRISRAYITTSTDALGVLVGLPPLSLKLKAVANLALATRLRNYLLIRDVSAVPVFQQYSPRWLLHPDEEPSTSISLSYKASNYIQDHDDSRLALFTDGSKTGDGVSSAFCVFDSTKLIASKAERIGDCNTVFQAELHAIDLALRWLEERDRPRAVIYSDSESSLKALSHWRTRDSQVVSIKRILNNFPAETLLLKWVKAHHGIHGNETADALAKAATLQSSISKATPKCPRSHLKSQFKNALLVSWQDRWTNSEKGRPVFDLIPRVSHFNYSRHRLFPLVYSGHGPFPAYHYRFHNSDSSNCVCGGEGSPMHFMQQCPLTEQWHLAGSSFQLTSSALQHLFSKGVTRALMTGLLTFLMENSHSLTNTARCPASP